MPFAWQGHDRRVGLSFLGLRGLLLRAGVRGLAASVRSFEGPRFWCGGRNFPVFYFSTEVFKIESVRLVRTAK